MSIPVLPPQLKTLNHCLKIASEHDVRDPVVAYWCRFYAVQQGLCLDKSSTEARTFLFALMDWLEKRKKELKDNEAITNEAVAEAHIENYALRIFNWADGQDRAGIFNKNVIKTFYTAGILIDVLTNFNKGELSEDLVGTRKYAKWKAAYINNCLKNGETPHAGPFPEGGDAEDADLQHAASEDNPQPPYSDLNIPGASSDGAAGGYWPSIDGLTQPVVPQPHATPSPPATSPRGFIPQPQLNTYSNVESTQGPASLSVSEMTKAQKYCKWAVSAIDHEDIATAITNLERALRLLKTGQDDA